MNFYQKTGVKNEINLNFFTEYIFNPLIHHLSHLPAPLHPPFSNSNISNKRVNSHNKVQNKAKTSGAYNVTQRGKRQSGWEQERAGLVEYCQWEAFEPKCEQDEVVIIKTAYYGRMKLGKCVASGVVGCFKEVTDLVGERCGGRRWCRLGVPDQGLDSTAPCEVELKSYLMVSHTCVKGASVWMFLTLFKLLSIYYSSLSIQQTMHKHTR